MKNKILYFFLFIYFFSCFYSVVRSEEQFNFDVTEIEVLENGNIIKGLKKGTVSNNDGITIIADTFVYNKKLETLTANGNVEAIDKNKNLKIYTQNLIYQKNSELITTKKNSKASRVKPPSSKNGMLDRGGDRTMQSLPQWWLPLMTVLAGFWPSSMNGNLATTP